ncbi:hypothetical protein A2154_00770 [Candidatus Gottesmanbacteria bacterium RBG_16_43_7]|uniref:Cohesin domain-containing protein n=1 Tax=Candidatus Gottesmanbacteria bacterium RBG_16_43_7 TaxID=1798373 RepID=A0A1F5Z886_9BACT|nr:MAG: hypothetical protein A2154_00770 [Candidatus Gottesmanbacteria bacterium RBG_16_43_7]
MKKTWIIFAGSLIIIVFNVAVVMFVRSKYTVQNATSRSVATNRQSGAAVPTTAPLTIRLTLVPQPLLLTTSSVTQAYFSVDGPVALLGFDLILNYNPQEVEVTAARAGEYFPQAREFVKKIENDRGTALLTFGSMNLDAQTRNRQSPVAVISVIGKIPGVQGKITIDSKSLASDTVNNRVNFVPAGDFVYTISK